jgi:F0F1-type ATP synthase assembly protein I
MASEQTNTTMIPGTAPLRRRHNQFTAWRVKRPFLGGVLLLLAGLIIGYVPLQFAGELIFIGGTFTIIGLVFATFVFLTGVGALAMPEHATIFGVAGVALSILSLMGALGGLLIGMLLGIIGGNLCVAWKNERKTGDDASAGEASA